MDLRAALGREKSQEAEAAQVELLTTAVAQAFFALKPNMKKKHLQEKLVESLEAIFRLADHHEEQGSLLPSHPPCRA
jgi:hypothetical protein